MTITVKDLAATVQAMRRLQSEYYKGRDRVVLEKAKRLERDVDKLCRDVLNPHAETPLFETDAET
jgi:hypothetical protein